MEYRIGILQTSRLGYGVYRRLGFQDYGKLSVYLWENDSFEDEDVSKGASEKTK